MVVRPRKIHGNADSIFCLEPLPIEVLEQPDDQLLDGHIFEEDIVQPEDVDILNYLKSNITLTRLSPSQLKAFLYECGPYTLLMQVLYKKGIYL